MERTVNAATDTAKTKVTGVKESAERSLNAVRRGIEEGRMAYRDAMDDMKTDETLEPSNQ